MDPIRGFSLAAVVLLSLVLPLSANAWLPGVRTTGRKHFLRAVWFGQLLGAVGGLGIIAVPIYPEYAVVATFVACLACLVVLRRQMAPAGPSRA